MMGIYPFQIAFMFVEIMSVYLEKRFIPYYIISKYTICVGEVSSCGRHTGKATKGKVQDIGEVNKVMPLPLPSSVE